MKSNWLVALSQPRVCNTTLICFPYAGGGASVYRKWVPFFDRSKQILAVQYPGRETRFNEPLIRHHADLVEPVAQAIIEQCVGQKIALFGHSMGAILAYEVARRLQKLNVPAHLLIVSGRSAPGSPSKRARIGHLADHEFVTQLAQYKGTPAAVLENAELLELLVPMLKCDFLLAEQYVPDQHQTKVNLPIWALGSHQDPWIDKPSIELWHATTNGRFDSFWFEGDHFYLNERTLELVDKINHIITSLDT